MQKINRKYIHNGFSANVSKSKKKGALSFFPEFVGVELGWLYTLGLVPPIVVAAIYFYKLQFFPSVSFSDGASVVFLLSILAGYFVVFVGFAYVLFFPLSEFIGNNEFPRTWRGRWGLRRLFSSLFWLCFCVGVLLWIIGMWPGGWSSYWLCYINFSGHLMAISVVIASGFLLRDGNDKNREHYDLIVAVSSIIETAGLWGLYISGYGAVVYSVLIVLVCLYSLLFVRGLGVLDRLFVIIIGLVILFWLLPVAFQVGEAKRYWSKNDRVWSFTLDGKLIRAMGYAGDNSSIIVKGDAVKYFEDMGSESDSGVIRCKISDDQIIVHGVDVLWHGLGSRSLIDLRKGGGRIQLDSSLMQIVSSDKYLCVDMPTKVYFATGKAEDESSGIDAGSGNVGSWFKSDVDKLGDDLKNIAGRYDSGSFPDGYCLKKVAIKGNTDLMPAENFELGLRRANYVGGQINSALDKFAEEQLTKKCEKEDIGCKERFCKAPEREVSSEGARNSTIKQGCSQNIKGLTEKLLGQCGAPNRFVSVRLIFVKSDQWSEERPAPEEKEPTLPVVQGCWALKP